MNKKYPYLVLDIECSKKPILNPWQQGSFLSSIGIQTPDGESFIWFFNPLIGDDSQHLREIQEMLDQTDLLVGHNLKFDLAWLYSIGLKVNSDVWCTMVAKYLINGQDKTLDYKLNDVAADYNLGSKLDEMAEYWARGIDTDQIPIDLHREYLTQDLSLTRQIYLNQFRQVIRMQLGKVTTLTCRLTKVLAMVELTGAPFSMEAAEQYLVQAAADLVNYKERMFELAGVEFNPASHVQLAAVLYGGTWKADSREYYNVTLKDGTVKEKSRKCKIDIEYPGLGFTCPEFAVTKAGNPGTGKEILKHLKPRSKKQKEFQEELLGFKYVDKMCKTLYKEDADAEDTSAWMNLVTDDGRLHGSFNQIMVLTGRLSSSKPNMQNLPRSGTSPLKKIFVARPGYVILNADLAQIEWRVAAELSRDPVMLQELYDGVDIHDANAVQIFGAILEHKKCGDEKLEKEFEKLRQAAKTVSFRLLYGGSHWGFYFDFRMPDFSVERWAEIVDAFYAKYQGLRTWQIAMQDRMRTEGFIRTPSGRVIPSPEVNWNDPRSIKSWERDICNYPVQSFSADVINTVIYKLMIEQGLMWSDDAKLIFLVHDSMVFECKQEFIHELYDRVVDIFSNLTTIISKYFDTEIVVPLDGDCELGFNYGETSKIRSHSDIDTILLKG